MFIKLTSLYLYLVHQVLLYLSLSSCWMNISLHTLATNEIINLTQENFLIPFGILGGGRETLDALSERVFGTLNPTEASDFTF